MILFFGLLKRFYGRTGLVTILFWLVCEGTVARLAKFTRKEARLAKINLCDTCLQLSQEAQMVLADPDTPKQVISVADQLVCSPLQPGLKKKVSCFRSCL
jgi:hypothetical protein